MLAALMLGLTLLLAPELVPITPSIDASSLFPPLFEDPQIQAASRAYRFGNFGQAASLAWKAILSGGLPGQERNHAAFLHAVALLRSGQRSAAVTAFRSVLADEVPAGLCQHAAWYHGKLLLDLAPRANLKEARQTLLGIAPSSRFGHQARVRLIRALLNAGELDDACELAAQATRHYWGSYREASARYLLGRCRHRQGIKQRSKPILREAATIYREVVTIWPGTPAATSAMEHLTGMRERKIWPLPAEPAPLLERARHVASRIRSKRDLYTLRRIRTLLPKAPKDPSRSELDLIYAELAARHRWFRTARYTLNRVLKRTKEPELLARATFDLAGLTSRINPVAAIAEYLSVQKNWPGASIAPLALYKAGTIARRYNDDKGARSAFINCLEKYPHTSAAAHCRWGMAWMEYSNGHYEKALPWMEFLLAATDLFPDNVEDLLQSSEESAAEPDTEAEEEVEVEEEVQEEEEKPEEEEEPSPVRAETPVEIERRRFLERAGYWRARTLHKLGQPQKAIVAYRRLVEQHPYDYYALMAWERLALMGQKVEHNLPKSLSKPDQTANHPEVAAAIAYLRMGWPAECRETLKRLHRPDLPEKDRRVASLLWLALGDIQRSHRISPVLWEGGLSVNQDLLDCHLAYPQAYSEIVNGASRDPGVEPELLYALMRAESGFKAKARSTAQALGLTQVVRRTAYRVAQRIKLKGFRFWKLYQPEVSIRIGSAHLAELLSRYDGNPALTLAAYNAGERAVARWLARRGDLPLDAFIEEIPFAETNRYVKKVLSFMAIYRALYQPPRKRPLEIDFKLPKKSVAAARKMINQLRLMKQEARKAKEASNPQP